MTAGLTACANDPSAASPSAPSAIAVAPGSDASHRWHFGSRRYRDRGHRPGRGMSGMAVAQAEAVFGSDGLTTLTLTSYRAGNTERPAGDIEHALVKIFDPSGRLVGVRIFESRRVHGPSITETLRGLAPGFTIRAWISVSGLDRKRVDMVAVPPVVIGRRPDLAVTALSLPSVLLRGAPTIISATIAELSGDNGATANCLLKVDNVIVDRANGIWVDAGDEVSCAFTYTFTTTGTHHVVVLVDNVSPADNNALNNAKEADVTVSAPSEVIGGGAAFATFSASVRSGTFSNLDSFSTRWTQPSGFLFLDAHDVSGQSGSEQSATISGVIGKRLAFPLPRIELRQSTAGALVHAAQYADLPPDDAGNADCLSRGVGTGTEFYLCSDPGGFTSFTYRRATGTVTYVSDQYQSTWNGSSYDVTAYVDNGTTVTTGTVVPFSGTFAFDVRITDQAGTYVVSQSVPLAPFTEAFGNPSTCTTNLMSIPPQTYTARTCTFSAYQFTGVAGSASGQGSVTAQNGLRLIP